MVNQPTGNHELGIGVVRFDLGPLLQGQTRIPKLKSVNNSLIILEVCNVKSTYRKSWTRNLLM